ncbi:MAG: 2-C-methyl-D-erythritol 4-phosphate cytidylyltransferase [Muribaculaceae bacterium]|nr:2-C-methyl-D-erythritol 4-phosphate cytidylyltransferase [Muribaculaceae bacterium]
MLINYHIVVAAGSGLRYGGPLPKQFCSLWGRPVLMTTLERLAEAAPGAEIIVVLSPDMIDMWTAMCREHGFTLPHIIATGGETRAWSVRNALAMIDPLTVGWISVHDAARPLVTPALFSRLLKALHGADGVIPAVPVTDSLRVIDPDGTSRAVDRSIYRAVQTPQLFDGRKLIEANRCPMRPEFTDDASVMEAAGFDNLRLAPGDVSNIKITHSGDIERIERDGRPS